MRADEITQQFAHAVIAHRVARADAQLAAEFVRAAAAHATKLAVALQQFLRQGQQFAAARVEPQAPPLAGEYRGIQLPLHFRQGHARRGLGEVQRLGGGAHAAQAGDLHEHLELARADIDHQLILLHGSIIPSFPD